MYIYSMELLERGGDLQRKNAHVKQNSKIGKQAAKQSKTSRTNKSEKKQLHRLARR
jgi:hypothetical protein